jgi:hypothetical protein
MEKLACMTLTLFVISITLYYSIDWDENRFGKHPTTLFSYFFSKSSLGNEDETIAQVDKKKSQEVRPDKTSQ